MSQAVGKTEKIRVGERLLTQRDRRADGGARHVRVTRADILIARRYGGVAMMIAAPVEAYRGVGLIAIADLQGDILYRLTLVHRDADLDIVLAESRDSAEALAAWAEWAAWFDLARLAIRDDEWVTIAATGTGGAFAARRRRAFLARRRPAFLTRRKTGDAGQSDAIFVDEREISSRE